MKKQANSKSCFVCGKQNPYGLHMEFFTETNGSVRAIFQVPIHFQGYPGIVHGGVIASILDEAAGRTVLTQNENPRWMVTAKLDIRYRKPVPVDVPLNIFGFIKEDNGIIVKTRGEIRSEDGDLLAEADQTLMDIPPAVLQNVKKLHEDEWAVYGDEK